MRAIRKKHNDVDCSVLLDSLILSTSKSSNLVDIDGIWLQAKPLNILDIRTVYLRIKAAIRIIRGKSFAVHYAEDIK